MKKTFAVFFACTLLLTLCSCGWEEKEEITDALQIKACVLNKELEGTGYWSFDNNTTLAGGRWVFYDDADKKIADSKVFTLETLAQSDVRVMAPLNYGSSTEEGKFIPVPNIYIIFDFDGTVEVGPEIENDPRILLSYSSDFSDERVSDGAAISNSTTGKVSMQGPVMISVCIPGDGYERSITPDTKLDGEYYLNVKTYLLDGTPAVTAKLKLTPIEDEGYPPEAYKKYGDYLHGDVKTRFFSIELVSYEYSDIYELD